MSARGFDAGRLETPAITRRERMHVAAVTAVALALSLALLFAARAIALAV